MLIDKFRPDELYNKIVLTRQECGVSFFLKENKQFINISCPACAEEVMLQLYFIKYGYRHLFCNNCCTVFVSPRPTEEQLNDYYTNYTAPKLWTELLNETNAIRKKSQHDTRLDIIKDKLVKQGNNKKEILIDIGAGNGSFASLVKKSGLFKKVLALDISIDCINACKQLGLDTYHGILQELQDNSLDFITMNDLIEHLFDPRQYVKVCYEKLRTGGIIMITTPNGKGFDFQLLKDKTENITPPEHLQYFNPESIEQLLSQSGFIKVEVSTPGVLDVEIVKKQIERKNLDLSTNNLFLDYLFGNTSETTLKAFQEFLSNNKLSSHMLAVAVKE